MGGKGKEDWDKKEMMTRGKEKGKMDDFRDK